MPNELATIVATLNRRAVALWGRERANSLEGVIDEAAQDIWQIFQATPLLE